MPDLRTFLPRVMVIWPAIGLVVGLATQLSGWQHWAGPIWAVATVPVLVVLLIEIVVSLRRGDVGLDVLAAVAPIVGLPCIVAAAPNLAMALGYDTDEALEQ